MEIQFTEKQGQYLAFIYFYTKINGRPTAEKDMQSYFHVTPPSVHQMILTLERLKLIERQPGVWEEAFEFLLPRRACHI